MLARGVACLHECGILHRDLHSGNVLIALVGGFQPEGTSHKAMLIASAWQTLGRRATPKEISLFCIAVLGVGRLQYSLQRSTYLSKLGGGLLATIGQLMSELSESVFF